MAKIYTFTDADLERLRDQLNLAVLTDGNLPTEGLTAKEQDMARRVRFQSERWIASVTK